MKYLVKRDDFIRTAKSVNNSDFLLEKAKNSELFEAAGSGGPFYNENAWNDTLLGRLVNHIIRKAKIAFDLLRIKPLIMRLRFQFDQLAADGTIAAMDSAEDQSGAFRVILSKLYEELVTLVDNSGNVGEIKRVTKESIQTTVELIPKFGKEEGQTLNVAKDELEKFLEFLNQFKDDEGGEATVSEDDEETEDVQDPSTYRLKNFGHLFNMLLIYQGIQRDMAVFYQELRKKQQATPAGAGTPAPNATVSAGAGTPAPATGTTQNASRLYSYDQFMTVNEDGVAKTAGRIVGSILKFFRGGKDEKQEAPETKQLMDSLKKLWQVFNTEKGVLEQDSELHKFLKDPESAKKSTSYNKFMSNINRIYEKVQATGVVKEGVHELLGKADQIGSFIAAIYNVTKSKNDGRFQLKPGVVPEVWDELCSNVAGFNESIKECLPEKASKGIEPGRTVSWTSQKTGDQVKSEILRIEGNDAVFKAKNGQEFKVKVSKLKLVESLYWIFEADEPTPQATPETPATPETTATPETPAAQTEPGLIETGTVSERIKDFFDKRCKTVRNYVLDKTEVDKITANLEKLKDSKEFVIDGIDPVIQIVRLFNRAYKIYTTETITKRKDGKVSPSVFNEYTSFGGRSSSGDLNGWSGPYRNKKVFNQWEDAVLSIMADKKYEFIFSKSTVLRLPKVSDPKTREDYEYRKGAGAKLRDFILELLDGEELYKVGTDKGAQRSFLEKYFGKLETTDDVGLTLKDDNPAEIKDIQTKIDNSAKKLSFQVVEAPKKTWNGHFYALEVTFKEGDEEKTGIRFFYNFGGKMVMFCKTFYYFQEMIKYKQNSDPLDGRKFVAEKGKLVGDKLEDRAKPQKGDYWQMNYAASKNNLEMLFKKNQIISIDYVNGKDGRDIRNEKFKINKILWLCETNEENKFVPFDFTMSAEDFKSFDQKKSTSNVKLQPNPPAWLTNASRTGITVANGL